MTVVKDWALEAAVEILDLIDITAHDESEVAEIIKSRCPFKTGIAYVPVDELKLSVNCGDCLTSMRHHGDDVFVCDHCSATFTVAIRHAPK